MKIATPLKVKQAIDFNTGTSATRDVVSSIFDYTVGRVKTVGHGILQANPKSSEVTSAGNKEAPYFISGFQEGVNEGWPASSNWWTGLQFPSGFSSYKPSLINNLNDLYFGRINIDGSGVEPSLGWRRIYNTGNILGTVSQSGGVPTGAIIESGSNVNGEYVKYADGTLICTAQVTYNIRQIGVVSFTMPSTFAEIPSQYQSTVGGLTNLPDVDQFSSAAGRPTSSTFRLIRGSDKGGSDTDVQIRITAIGRWYI